MPSAVLERLPLFEGIAEDELALLAEATRTLEVPKNEDFLREGEEGDGLYVILTGRVKMIDQLPAERELELADVGAGGVLGEIPLLGGGPLSATARTLEDSRFLVLGRNEFQALLARATPGAVILRERLLALVCYRLRKRLVGLARRLGGEPPPANPAAGTRPEAADAPVPPTDYLHRLPFFRGFDRSSLVDLLAVGRVVELPKSSTLLEEGALSNGCWITLSGAVEELIRREGGVIRVGLAGPGTATGYLGLVDGATAAVTAATRERARLLYVAPDVFGTLFDPTHVGGSAFRQAIERDLIRALRAAMRPQARLEYARGSALGP